MTKGIWLVLAVILLFFAAGGIGYIISIFNSLVQVKNNIGKAWHNIDVLLIQRNEELPKLIDLTRAYVTHEKEVIEKIVRLRGLYEKKRKTPERTRLANEFESAFSQLKVVWEGYPDLKANQLFLRTQERVTELEESISERRAFFNETVKIYNTQIEQYPQAVFAWLVGFRPHPYLETKFIRKEPRREDIPKA